MQWRSLRSRIVVLAVLTCAFLAMTTGGFALLLRNTQTITVANAQRRLDQLAQTLARTYSSQAAGGLSLRQVHAGLDPAHKPLPPPPPPPPKPGTAPAPPPPLPADPYASITTTVLQHEDGIEGGLLAANGPLVGYAFPTHEGPGPVKDMPQRERPWIDQLAHKAEATATPQDSTFEGQHDVVLFAAAPVYETVQGKPVVTGAAWLMQRLPGVNQDRNRQVLLASISFSVAALITALLAWIALVEIRGGVGAIRQRLEEVQQGSFSAPAPTSRAQLAEFEGVLAGINTMATTLQHRVDKERTLEAELRHRERLSALGQFAAGVAHELRNPLATIRLRAQMSQDAQTPSTIARNSRTILEEVDRLDVMIGRLLSFARPIALHLQIFDVRQLCEECVARWRARSNCFIELVTQDDTSGMVRADRGRLTQVLDNLMENAVQATAAAGPARITMQLKQTAHTTTVQVIDNGPGFSREALQHALDPFFTTRDSGTGLGLSIAFELVQAHNGDLTIASDGKHGATVSVVLPRDANAGETKA